MIRYGSVAEFPVRLTLVDAAPRVCRALVTGIVRTACVIRATLRSRAFVVFCLFVFFNEEGDEVGTREVGIFGIFLFVFLAL